MMTEEEFNEWFKNQWGISKERFEGIYTRDIINDNAAFVAAKKGNVNALEYIAEHAPELIVEKDNVNNTIAHYAKSIESLKFIEKHAPETLNAANEGGFTPTHIAAYARNFEVFKFLAEKFPDELHNQPGGCTPAHHIAEGYSAGDTIKKLEYIAEHAPETFSMTDKNGSTPAHCAAGKDGRVDALKFLAERVPETFSMRDENGSTPAQLIMEYSEYYEEEAIEKLSIIAQYAPETLPKELFDNSKKNEKLLRKVFEVIKKEMKENYENSKEYLDKCTQKIEQINKVVSDKKQEYQEKIKKAKNFNKTLKKEKIEREKNFNKTLENLGKHKGKGE